jgi:glycosyltransferase involved in cell wall biosynthesis
MRILHLSTHDNSGGAARAAFRLHNGLIQQAVDSRMFVRNKYSHDEAVIRYRYLEGFDKILYKYRRSQIEADFNKYRQSRPLNQELFSDDRSALKTGFFKQFPEADIYHLHWISGFVDLPSFFKTVNKPLVWTLHDMFPFTGGCHYSNGCEKYKIHCSKCPQLGSVSEKDLSYYIWERKYKAISGFKNRIIIRADSYWLANEARKSSLFKDLDIDTIHYGIETDEFMPRDKFACRKALNIPDNSRVIVFGAPGIDNPRKGFNQLLEALFKLRKIYSNLFLLSFGSGTLPASTGIPNLHLGNVGNNHLLSLIYNCADVFVIPSLQEAFGQTALEAMSCGIPVAGFNTGGIPDMIENGITGYLAETGNTDSLTYAISRLLKLDNNEYQKMSDNCREKVISGFSIKHQAVKYIGVYQNLR